jgi:hypothetical protein
MTAGIERRDREKTIPLSVIFSGCVAAGFVPATSIILALCSTVWIAGTSPAMDAP